MEGPRHQHLHQGWQEPLEELATTTSRPRRPLVYMLMDPPCVGHAAIFAWSDLIFYRSRMFVGLLSPVACATRAGGDSGPNFENYDFFPRPVPGHRARCSCPFVAGEPGCRRQALVSWVLFGGVLVGSVTRWPLRGREKKASLLEPHRPRHCASPLHGEKANAAFQGAKTICCGARRP